MGRSAFEKFVGGAAGGVADYTDKVINTNLEEIRRRRLAEVERQAAANVRDDEAAFRDSRYDMESKREIDQYEKKKEIDKRYATPRGGSAASDKSEIKKYGSTTDELGNTVDKYAVYDAERRGWFDTETGAPVGQPPAPKEATADHFARYKANKPEGTWEEFKAGAESRGYKVPDSLRSTVEESQPGSVIEKATRGEQAAPPPRVDVLEHTKDPTSGAEVVSKINDGTLDAWRKHGMDVRQYLQIGRSIAGAKDRRIIDQYLSNLK